jgi:D-glycero-D-manno-heptose 1,7-bisphosphate phosphatase
MKRGAVFLDRDGVINAYVYNPEFGTVDSPTHPNEFVLLPGSAQAIAELNRMGLPVVVVSNQPGIAKRKFTPGLLAAMTEKMHVETRDAGGCLDGVYYCLHHPESQIPDFRINCACRKPSPGLLIQAAEELGLDLAKSYMVGDGVTDILAGTRAGTTTIFVSPRKCYICDELVKQNVRPTLIVSSLLDAVKDIDCMERNMEVPRDHFTLSHCFDSLEEK